MTMMSISLGNAVVCLFCFLTFITDGRNVLGAFESHIYIPRIVVSPQKMTHVTQGQTFVLSCQATGSPTPRITWLKNGTRLSHSYGRVVAIESEGYLVVADAQLSDTGIYHCVAYNRIGNASQAAKVLVSEYSSGCANGATDGLHYFEEIHACRGRWEGHVKRARGLCRPGWQVCSPRHSSYLKMLTWSDASQSLEGCYAYNAANTLNLCTPCVQSNMAGVGRDCGRMHIGQGSCLTEGRIDAYREVVDTASRCNYTSGVTTGVLCCKKPQKWQTGYQWKNPKCNPRCQHGGVCVSKDRCHCAPGYKGAYCQNPVCAGGCIPNSSCVKPDVCRCNAGFSGSKCRTRDIPKTPTRDMTKVPTRGTTKVPSVCELPCLNGGRCLRDHCKCPPTHHGSQCQHVV